MKRSDASTKTSSDFVDEVEDGESVVSRTDRKKVTQFNNRSFLSLLVRSFVSFALIIAFSTILVIFLSYRANNSDLLNVNYQTIENYRNELIYNPLSPSIPIKTLFGEGGWLDIVDPNGNVVYSSQEGHTYTAAELDCINRYASGATVRAHYFKLENNDYNYLITKTYSDGTEENLLLDSDLFVITGSMSLGSVHYRFTQREFDLLVYNTSNGGKIIEKYDFESADGKLYYAIYLDVNNSETTSPVLFMVFMALGVFALLVLALIMYIRYINKHVQHPLNTLENAMHEFAAHNYRKEVEYTGSVEFEELVDSFNEMVSLLNESEAQRVLLEEDRQRMLAGLSHDLKTPITVIQGFTKAIRDGLVSDEEKQNYLNLILAKTEHMGKLINEFYEYSQLDHPDFKLNVEPIDIAEVVREYLANIYSEFDIHGDILEADITEESVICQADKSQFVRVLENLISNFFKYTPTGSTLHIGAHIDGDDALITAADNGGGIDESVRKDIFAPFVVGEKSRNKQGTGLGLAVCDKIMQAHGGSISLSDNPPENFNLQFDIRLPIYKAGTPPPRPPRERRIKRAVSSTNLI